MKLKIKNDFNRVNNEKSLILELGKEKKIAADIEYILSKKMLLMPTLAKTVVTYKFNE